jgi:hypothetical protein
MWATLALTMAVSLAPQQTAALKLTNDRATYGVLGATRTENKLLPGDIYFVTFDIENLSVSETGKVEYSMGMQLLNSQNKPEFTKDPQDLEATNSLGGNRMPGFAAAEVGTETAPGKYTLKVTVTDRRAKKTEVLTREFEVLPKSFGLVRVHMTYLQAAIPAPPLAVAGQSILINCAAVNFKRNDDKKQPDIGLQITIVDEKGNPTLTKPFTDEVVKDVPEKTPAIPISLPLELNRPGKFTVKLQATDRITKKSVEVSFPLEVRETK